MPDTLICRDVTKDRTDFRVLDYRTNYSTFFGADVSAEIIDNNHDIEVFFALSRALKLASNYLLGSHSRRRQLLSSSVKKEYLSGPSHPCRLSRQTFPTTFSMTIPPKYPHSSKSHFRMVLYAKPVKFFGWRTVSPWYFGSESVYFDIIYKRSRAQRYKIIIKPDLSDASPHIINMSGTMSGDLRKPWSGPPFVCDGYRICEDSLVFWNSRSMRASDEGIILTSTPFTNVVARWNERIDALCPTSGRFVYCTYKL